MSDARSPKSRAFWTGKLKVLVACVAMGAASAHAPADQLPAGAWIPASRQEASLSMSGYTLSFADDFNQLDCAPGFQRPDRPRRWYSYGTFGDAAFASCAQQRESPYSIRSGALIITLSNRDGHWKSGALSTYNPTFGGFAQRYGIFTARIMLPKRAQLDLAAWPSFWLLSRYVPTAKPGPYAEIDAFEHFGQDKTAISTTVFIWPQKNARGDKGYLAKAVLKSQRNILDGRWHNYAVRWTPYAIDVFIDGQAIGRYAGSIPDTPMYPMLSLALSPGKNHPRSATYDMKVDWVRVYRCANVNCT